MVSTVKMQQKESLQTLKKDAFAYYKKNNIVTCIEEVLNKMFFDKPSDIYGYLANYFSSKSFPSTVCKLTTEQTTDFLGRRALLIHLFCTVKNQEQLISSSLNKVGRGISDFASPNDRQTNLTECQTRVSDAVALIQKFSDIFLSVDPTDQKLIDSTITNVINKVNLEEEERRKEEAISSSLQTEEILEKGETPSSDKKIGKSNRGKSAKGPAVTIIPEEPPEQLPVGFSAAAAFSVSFCRAGASCSNLPIYQHLLDVFFQNITELPLPLVTVMCHGKTYPGKLSCIKEISLFPRHDLPLEDAITKISCVYHALASLIATKATASLNVSQSGAITLVLDKPESALDIVMDAIRTSLDNTDDFFISLNCAAHECFDYEKGKYEVAAGIMKTPDEFVTFLSDLVTKYDLIKILIDPLRREDKQQWLDLGQCVGSRCLIVGANAHYRAARLCTEDIANHCKTSGVVLKLKDVTTISDIIAASDKMKANDNVVILSASDAGPEDHFVADLAVATRAKFLHIPAPIRAENVCLLNRLLNIKEKFIQNGGKLETSPLQFTQTDEETAES